MGTSDQLPLPFVFEPPDPRPKPDKRKAIAVKRKPVERAGGASHPEEIRRTA